MEIPESVCKTAHTLSVQPIIIKRCFFFNYSSRFAGKGRQSAFMFQKRPGLLSTTDSNHSASSLLTKTSILRMLCKIDAHLLDDLYLAATCGVLYTLSAIHTCTTYPHPKDTASFSMLHAALKGGCGLGMRLCTMSYHLYEGRYCICLIKCSGVY